MVENPSDLDSPVGVALQAAPDVVDSAVDAARSGGERWRSMTGAGRAEALERVATELLARTDELGRLLASEEGKTLTEARGEVARAGQIFRYFAGEAVRLGGEVLESVRPGVEVELRHEPLGIVAAITPWNFPIAIPAWKIAPALAYGNTSSSSRRSPCRHRPCRLADIVQRAGLPAGVSTWCSAVGGGR